MANTKALVVEDDPFIGELVVDLHEAGGYTVVQFQDGEDFLERVKRERPSHALLDFQLPGVYGVPLAQRLRADSETRGISILALSAEARSEKQALVLKAGFDGYLTQPLDRGRCSRPLPAFSSDARPVMEEPACAPPSCGDF